MSDEREETEAVRVKRDFASARRSFIIIFTVGIVGTVTAVALVMKNRPAGDLGDGYGRPTPAFAPHAALKRCRKFGESCELSPGKLGSCQQKEQCTGPNCFFCQSQH